MLNDFELDKIMQSLGVEKVKKGLRLPGLAKSDCILLQEFSDEELVARWKISEAIILPRLTQVYSSPDIVYNYTTNMISIANELMRRYPLSVEEFLTWKVLKF